MPNFGIWATLYGFNGLESRKKNLNGLQIIIIIIFWLGHDLGCRLGPNLVGLNKARGACLGLGKKIRLIIGLGPNHGSGYEKPGPLPFLLVPSQVVWRMVHASLVLSIEDIFLNSSFMTALNRAFNALLLKFAALILASFQSAGVPLAWSSLSQQLATLSHLKTARKLSCVLSSKHSQCHQIKEV